MDDELTKTLKYLRLSGLLAHWDEYLTLARQQRFSHVRLLASRAGGRVQDPPARMPANCGSARARIPELLRMETFPFERSPSWTRNASCPSTTPSIT